MHSIQSTMLQKENLARLRMKLKISANVNEIANLVAKLLSHHSDQWAKTEWGLNQV